MERKKPKLGIETVMFDDITLKLSFKKKTTTEIEDCTGLRLFDLFSSMDTGSGISAPLIIIIIIIYFQISKTKYYRHGITPVTWYPLRWSLSFPYFV